MFEYMKGTITHASPDKITIDINGIGYALFIPLSTYTKLPPLNQEATFYLSLVIKEDAHRLYAFLSSHERNLFDKLRNISGIGPKTALGIVGHMDQWDLYHAIERNDVTLLSKLPGIGKKTAQRLILEMKDQKAPLPLESHHHNPSLSEDAISALMNLGYSSAQAQKAVKKALTLSPPPEELPLLITSALQEIS